MILGLTYFFSTVKEGMDMICVNYLVLLKEVECSKYKAANNHPHDECIIFFTNGIYKYINVILSINRVM